MRAALRAEDSTDTQRNWPQWGRSTSLLFSRIPFDVFALSEVSILRIVFTKINTTKAQHSSCVFIFHNEMQVYEQAAFDFHCTPHINSTCTDHAGTDSAAASAIKSYMIYILCNSKFQELQRNNAFTFPSDNSICNIHLKDTYSI